MVPTGGSMQNLTPSNLCIIFINLHLPKEIFNLSKNISYIYLALASSVNQPSPSYVEILEPLSAARQNPV